MPGGLGGGSRSSTLRRPRWPPAPSSRSGGARAALAQRAGSATRRPEAVVCRHPAPPASRPWGSPCRRPPR
eukprot:5440260-Alexandrium_andersonii.AAC.1